MNDILEEKPKDVVGKNPLPRKATNENIPISILFERLKECQNKMLSIREEIDTINSKLHTFSLRTRKYLAVLDEFEETAAAIHRLAPFKKNINKEDKPHDT